MFHLNMEAGSRVGSLAIALSLGTMAASNAAADVVSPALTETVPGFDLYPRGTVNAVLGDESFLALRGSLPDVETNEDLRLATHLEYVEQQLRAVDTSAWSEERRDARDVMLDHLHDYWTAGVFPHNEAYDQERRPCFIDPDGRICAVGYLIEVTAGRDVSEAINERWQYEYLLEMDMPEIDAWIGASGLTAVECAMIQPCYGRQRRRDVWHEYTVDFGNGYGLSHEQGLFLDLDVPLGSFSDTVQATTQVRLTIEMEHSRFDDLDIFMTSPETTVPVGYLCYEYDSPSITTHFAVANDAPFGGEDSALDGIYEWRDAPSRTIEDGAALAAGGTIASGRYSSYYDQLSDYTHDVLIRPDGTPSQYGAWAVGEWGIFISDTNANLHQGLIHSVTLGLKYAVAPTPGAIPLLGLILLTGSRRRR